MTVTERVVRTNGVELHVMEAGEGFPVVLSHGFPELAYSWRHQLPALAEAGYRAIAPDQRGYGRTSRPEALEDYDILKLTDDLLGVLDDIGEQRGVFVGHDWGAMLVWHLAVRAPERVAGVVGMSVPYLPRGPRPPIQSLRRAFGDNFFYILYFQEPGVADAELGRDPARTMRRMLAGLTTNAARNVDPAVMADPKAGFVDRLPEPESLPDWLTQEELDFYVEQFSNTGFTGGINWYRNMDRNWELTPELQERKIEVPSLFVGGKLDPVLLMSPPGVMDGWVSDHRGTILVEGAGHWVQQEKPGEVNEALLSFLKGLDLQTGKGS